MEPVKYCAHCEREFPREAFRLHRAGFRNAYCGTCDRYLRRERTRRRYWRDPGFRESECHRMRAYRANRGVRVGREAA